MLYNYYIIMTEKLENLKKSVLIFDLETCASYPDGTPISIFTDFENYVLYAKAKWFGCYSYKHDKYIGVEIAGNEDNIKNFLAEHKVLVGFNNEEFDTPILHNNDLMPDQKFLQVDNLVVLGASTYARHDGLPFKNRGYLMGYKYKKNSLKSMAEVMNLETQKGDIDYDIFFNETYTDEERAEILKYLKADVEVTKQMFDQLWDFWMPFTKFLSEKNVMNLSWIRSSIASLTYKAACHTMDVEETYADKTDDSKEDMGGRVIEPKYEEARGVWYVDVTSLYPHIFAMFNLFAEMSHDDIEMATVGPMGNGGGEADIWHGNDVFEVKGYYDISEQHILSQDVTKKLRTRVDLKKTDPDNPMVYALKIFLNSLYGAQRSPIFEQIHTPNGGWDCCWLGQQIQKLIEDMMGEFGFETIAGDTDSIFIRINPDPNKGLIFKKEDEKDYVEACLSKVIQKIKDNVPFPCDTFNIDIEDYVQYIMFPFSVEPVSLKDLGITIEDVRDKTINTDIFVKLTTEYYPDKTVEEIYDILLEAVLKSKDKKPAKINLKNGNRLIKKLRGKKKNYVYINGKGELTIKGLPIKKDNATALGAKILHEWVKPMVITMKQAKFKKEVINSKIAEYLKKPSALELLSVEYKVKPAATYKKESQIQAQISEGYFDGQDGVIRLIKNTKVGNAGKTARYCSIQECQDAELTIDDLDLTKLRNELQPFCERE